MKNVQVRFSDEVYSALNQISEEESTTIADIVRKGIQLYGILHAYGQEGKKLAIIDDERHIEAE